MTTKKLTLSYLLPIKSNPLCQTGVMIIPNETDKENHVLYSDIKHEFEFEFEYIQIDEYCCIVSNIYKHISSYMWKQISGPSIDVIYSEGNNNYGVQLLRLLNSNKHICQNIVNYKGVKVIQPNKLSRRSPQLRYRNVKERSISL